MLTEYLGPWTKQYIIPPVTMASAAVHNSSAFNFFDVYFVLPNRSPFNLDTLLLPFWSTGQGHCGY